MIRYQGVNILIVACCVLSNNIFMEYFTDFFKNYNSIFGCTVSNAFSNIVNSGLGENNRPTLTWELDIPNDRTRLSIFTRWYKRIKHDYVWCGDKLSLNTPPNYIVNQSSGLAGYSLLFYINNIFEGNYSEFDTYIRNEINKKRELIEIMNL